MQEETRGVVEDLLKRIRRGELFRDLPLVRVLDWREGAQGFDAQFRLESRGAEAKVYVEAKASCSPRTVAEIAPWVRRIKLMNPGTAVALACPAISPRAQQLCIDNDVDFLDLAGNVYINTGDFLLQRAGRDSGRRIPRELPEGVGNPFSPRSSRVVRVLLEKPGTWRLKAIAAELERETRDNPITKGLSFAIDMSSISRAVSGLAEDLLVRKRGQDIIVTDPGRLLAAWAEKYRLQLQRWIRDSVAIGPLSPMSLSEVATELRRSGDEFVITSAAAATVTAPYVDVDVIEAFATRPNDFLETFSGRSKALPSSTGLRIRIVRAYDAGVFMYARMSKGLPIASAVQVFLDLYGRGGRDRKQADYLLEQVIKARWQT